MPEPPPSRLRRLLKEHPRHRRRLARAIASLLGVGLVSLGVLGGLVVWHLVRRGRLIREGLSPPRKVGLHEFETEFRTRADTHSKTNTNTTVDPETGIEPKPTGAVGTDAEEEQGPRPS